MKWLSELDDIKTPDSWIEDTLNMTSRKEDNRGRRREEKRGSVVKMHKGAGNIVKAAVVAGVLIAVSGGSVYAYNQYVAKYSMSNTASSLDHMGQSVDEDGNVYYYKYDHDEGGWDEDTSFTLCDAEEYINLEEILFY